MKSLFASKTFWVNLLTLAATVSGYLPEKYAMVALPVVNMVLRYLTTQPVSVTGRGPQGRPDQGI